MFELVFDEVMIKQLQKAARNQQVKDVLVRLLDRLENLGPDAGELLDSKLFLYEMKSIRPPVRLYYKHNIHKNEIYVFEFEMKISPLNQKRTITRLRKTIKNQEVDVWSRGYRF